MQPNNPYQPVPPPQPHEYDFLTNQSKPPRRGFNLLPSNSSMPIRIAVIVGGLLILIIVFSIVKSVLNSGGNKQALLTVAQNQQEIIHLAQNATQGSALNSLSTTNQNFAVTAQATMTSAQAQLLAYMKTNHQKVSQKTLNLKVSGSLDTQIKTAIANTTYDSTFKTIMQGQLSDYERSLQAAYHQTKGPKGRTLLSKEYDGAQLLLQQLNAPAS